MNDEDLQAEEIIVEANRLAREFYRILVYVVREGYRFDRATHPHETMMWAMARAAYEHLRQTDLDDVLSEAEE